MLKNKYLLITGLNLITLILVSSHSHAEKPSYGNVVIDKLGTVYDGDTFSVTILQWPDIIGKNISVRLKNVDTPEMKGACYQEVLQARKAKQFTVQRLRNAKKVELKNISRDKYFRINADVLIDGKDLTQELINNHLGVAYSGGTKIDWCVTPSAKRE